MFLLPESYLLIDVEDGIENASEVLQKPCWISAFDYKWSDLFLGVCAFDYSMKHLFLKEING
jgi:hypothetical protein